MAATWGAPAWGAPRCAPLGAVALTLALAGTAGAQPAGYASVMLDALPNAPLEAVELRARLFAEETFRPSERVTIHLAGYADGLLADRGGRETAAIVRPQEAYIDFSGPRADLRVGYSRLVWGRLDEVQPSDTVNPLDLARYFFEGRAGARLPVPLARARLFFGERATLEGVLVPDFRPGRFDQLDEDSSPFLESGVASENGVVPLFRDGEPKTSVANVQGGGRASFTTGRVDWAVAAYRGFRSFPEYEILAAAPAPVVRQIFPRYTMLAGDFETAAGAWAWRGEAAVFLEDDGAGGGACRAAGCGAASVDAGAGFDRRAGGYHLSGTVLVRSDVPAFAPASAAGVGARLLPGVDLPPPARRVTTVSLVAAADRAFSRERYRTRAFGVFNINETALFLRNITAMELRDNLALEGSIGWFIGEGGDVIARFADRDFLYLRLRYHF